jgi:hypothetical protein
LPTLEAASLSAPPDIEPGRSRLFHAKVTVLTRLYDLLQNRY